MPRKAVGAGERHCQQRHPQLPQPELGVGAAVQQPQPRAAEVAVRPERPEPATRPTRQPEREPEPARRVAAQEALPVVVEALAAQRAAGPRRSAHCWEAELPDLHRPPGRRP